MGKTVNVLIPLQSLPENHTGAHYVTARVAQSWRVVTSEFLDKLVNKLIIVTRCVLAGLSVATMMGHSKKPSALF